MERNTHELERVKLIASKIDMNCLGNNSFDLVVDFDRKGGSRIFIQIIYHSPCTKTKEDKVWSGRKFYLSEHMTGQEIIGTIYLAFKLAVEHEVMEGFKVDGKILFNPHVSFEKLLEISNEEVTRP